MANQAELDRAPAKAKATDKDEIAGGNAAHETFERSHKARTERERRTLLNDRPAVAAQRQAAQGLAGREAGPRPVQRAAKPNRTGLPDRLKAGVESLSGIAMDDVRVHRNSAEPERLQAHAFTRGREIHVAPGQERHLPHEAWHVVQQAQGRVRATTQMKGSRINDDPGLEREADAMGARAATLSPDGAGGDMGGLAPASGPDQVHQLERMKLATEHAITLKGIRDQLELAKAQLAELDAAEVERGANRVQMQGWADAGDVSIIEAEKHFMDNEAFTSFQLEQRQIPHVEHLHSARVSAGLLVNALNASFDRIPKPAEPESDETSTATTEQTTDTSTKPKGTKEKEKESEGKAKKREKGESSSSSTAKKDSSSTKKPKWQPKSKEKTKTDTSTKPKEKPGKRVFDQSMAERTDVSKASGDTTAYLDIDQLKHQPKGYRIGTRIKGGGNVFGAKHGPDAAWHEANTLPHMIAWANALKMKDGEDVATKAAIAVGGIHYNGHCIMYDGKKYVFFHCYPANKSKWL